MGMRANGLGGGGQFKGVVAQIMEAESQPVKNLEQRKQKEETRLKTFQEFKGKFTNLDKALGDLADFSKFKELKVDLGDGASAVSVTLDKTKAQPGTYTVQIDQLAARSSVMSNGFTSADEPILGDGFVVVKNAKGEKTELYIEGKDGSLRGVANVINRQPDSPIRASIVKDAADPDAPWKLIISSKKEGAINALDIPDFYFVGSPEDFYIDEESEAQNAILHIDGFPIELESNDVEEFLPGINLHMKEARPDQPFTITISEDTQKIGGKLKDLVSQLNGVLQFIGKQNAVDEKTDTSTTFTGDTSLQNIEFRIRNVLHEGYPIANTDGTYRIMQLSELGVEFDRTGALTFKEEKFNKALDSNFDSVAEAITGESGFANRIRQATSGITRVGNGTLTLKEQALRQRIKNIDSQIDVKMRQLEKKQQSLTEQFSRLEANLGAMQRQQQSLQAMGMGGGGGNPISQLIG